MKPDIVPMGLVAKGTIDVHRRPVVRNPDGTISTVRSMSGTDDQGRTFLIPTVVNGQVVSEDDAWKHFLNTGEHLGQFKDWRDADIYGKSLHEAQALEYGDQTPAQNALKIIRASALKAAIKGGRP